MTESSLPIVLFGATTASGSAFLELNSPDTLLVAGRQCPPGWSQDRFLAIDLSAAGAPQQAAIPAGATVVSFAPIWWLAPFLSSLIDTLGGSNGTPHLGSVVACSSSSVLTKRFAANRQDRALVKRLLESEDLLEASCERAGIPCHILRPTLIYGQAGPYGDRNLSSLIRMMRRLPALPVPVETGLRQPIHARQLAAAALHLVHHPETEPRRLALGGDECLSYAAMLQRLQETARNNDKHDAAGRCLILSMPTALFHVLAAPLLPLSTKAFEAVLRMEANLGPFMPVHALLGTEAETFPVAPLAWGREAPTSQR